MQSQAALAATSRRHADHWRPWPWPPSPIRPFPRRMAVAQTQPRSISANGRLPAYWPATGAASRMPGCQRLWPACKSTASTPFGHLRHAEFQNGPFGIAIWAVWRCKTGRFTTPKALRCNTLAGSDLRLRAPVVAKARVNLCHRRQQVICLSARTPRSVRSASGAASGRS